MTQALRIETLGNLSITLNDTPVLATASRHKAEALLVYLACEQREHPRSVLATLFWEDYSQSRALANLRVVLHTLKQNMQSYLHITRQTVAFNTTANYWLDLETVTATLTPLLNRASHSTTRNISAADCNLLKDTLALYRGEFLAGFHISDSPGFEHWQRLRQEHLHHLVVEGYVLLARMQAAQGDVHPAIDTVRTLLQHAPLSEQGNYLLLKLLVFTDRLTVARQHITYYRQQLHDQLNIEPAGDTADLIARIMRDDPPDIVFQSPVSYNLPGFLTAFVPRPHVTAQIAERLQNDACRLLTLVGTGGTGKTRLAVEAARQHRARFPDGICFVSLALLRQSEFIPVTIANVLNIQTDDTTSVLGQLMDSLHNRYLLLLLDNCEHLPGAADVIHKLLINLPDLTILATSRSPLNLAGEWLLPVEGMTLPDTASTETPTEATSTMPEATAIRLFQQCAERVQPGFQLNEQRTAIYEFCQLVDGLPLAIELAASSLWQTDIPTLLARIRDSYQALAGNAHNMPERHHSIEATFNYSWDLLDTLQQKKLMSLAVFRGDFTPDAAYEIADVTPDDLRHLVRQSLVRQVNDKQYTLHTLLRRYLVDKLSQFGTVNAMYQQHYNYFLKQVTAILESDTGEISQIEQIDRMYIELQAALERTFKNDRIEQMVQLALKLTFFWERRTRYGEGRRWLEKALKADVQLSDALCVNLTYYAAMLAWGQSDYDAQKAYAAQNLQLARHIDEEEPVMRALILNGNTALHMQDYSAARQYLEEGLTLAKSVQDERRELILKANLGAVCLEDEDYAASIVYFEQIIPAFRQAGSIHHLATALANTGFAYLKTGGYDRSEQYLEEAIQLGKKVDNAWVQALATGFRGDLSEAREDIKQARDYHLQSLMLYHDAGNRAGIANQLTFVGALDVAQKHYRKGTIALTAAQSLIEELHGKGKDLPDRLIQALASARNALSETDFNTTIAEASGYSIDDLITLLQSV